MNRPGNLRLFLKSSKIQNIEMNGERVLAALNSYQALLRLLMADSNVLPPGVTEKAKGIFIYLPKMDIIDYGTEIAAYRRAMELLTSAA